jgi:hypothetical protein
MLCVIDISTLNKTYLIWFGTPFVSLPHKWLAWISVITSAFFLQTIACYTDWSRRIKITLRYKMILTTLKSGIQHGAWVSMWPNVTYSVSRNQQHTSIDLTTLYLKKSKTIRIGLSISNDLKWTNYINNICKKASSTVGFIRRNLKHSPAKCWRTAYISLVRSTLEYGTIIWDPYLVRHG